MASWAAAVNMMETTSRIQTTKGLWWAEVAWIQLPGWFLQKPLNWSGLVLSVYQKLID
jgi:hypothetical protein